MNEKVTDKEWRRAAVRFYNNEAGDKSRLARHALFSRRYRPVFERLALPNGSSLLDAGCGCGELTGAAGNNSIKVTGVDLSPESLRTARAFHPKANFAGVDLHNLPFADQSFDSAVAITSVEFCRNRPAVLQELRRVLKVRGRLYLDARNNAFLPFRIFKPVLPSLHKLGFLEPYPAGGFRDLTLDEWKVIIADAGFKIHSTHPSVWPWNFGSPISRFKNLIIEAVKIIFPIRYHYMVGLVLEKDSG